MEFIEWLQKEKNYKKRSARDVVSRLNRAKKILGSEGKPVVTLEMIEKSDDFKDLTTCVKSHLRKSLKLYDEYKKSN